MRDHDDEPPPFLGSWPRLYRAVILYLAAVIALFALLGAAFSPRSYSP